MRETAAAIAAACLLGAFIPVGCQSVILSLRSGEFRPPKDSFTTDSYLKSVIGPDASERTVRAMAALPGNKPVIIFVRDGKSVDGFVAALITYLAWPREVRAVPIEAGRVGDAVRAIDPARTAALMFYHVEPPPFLGSPLIYGVDLRVCILTAAQ